MILDWIAKLSTLFAAASAAYFSFKAYRIQREGKKIDLIIKDEEKLREKFVEFMGIAHQKMIIALHKEDGDESISKEELELDGKLFQLYTYIFTIIDSSAESEKILSDLQSIIDAHDKERLMPGLVMKNARIAINAQKRASINLINNL